MKQLFFMFLLLALLCASMFCCSCSAGHQIDANGKAVIVTVDTTIVQHGGHLYFKK